MEIFDEIRKIWELEKKDSRFVIKFLQEMTFLSCICVLNQENLMESANQVDYKTSIKIRRQMSGSGD